MRMKTQERVQRWRRRTRIDEAVIAAIGAGHQRLAAITEAVTPVLLAAGVWVDPLVGTPTRGRLTQRTYEVKLSLGRLRYRHEARCLASSAWEVACRPDEAQPDGARLGSGTRI